MVDAAGRFDFKYQGVSHKVDCLGVDSSFFSMFDVKILEGSTDFLIPVDPGSIESVMGRKIAITREKALQMFGNESPVGKKIEMTIGSLFFSYDICAVVTGLPKRSNYPFDVLFSAVSDMRWRVSYGGNVLIELVPGIDMKAFEKKLYGHEVQADTDIKNIMLIPLTSMRYKDINIARDVQFQHIIIFAVAGLLLILCTLFNYLTLFVSRFRIRQRELVLRTVYGASARSLFAMLSVEFLLSLTAALVPGLVLIDLVSSFFLTVSGIRLELPSIYLESVIYIAAVIAVALTVFFLTLVLFKRRTLDSSMRSNTKIFRRISVTVQLTVSIVFAFCTLVILKQMYYLHNSTGLGFSFKDRGAISVSLGDGQEIEILNDKMKQIPEIKETVAGLPPLLPVGGMSSLRISDWDGKQGSAEYITLFDEWISERYAGFYEFKLIEGEFLKGEYLTDGVYMRGGEKIGDIEDVLINESAAKIFGWDKAVGKMFFSDNGYNRFRVIGVVKDIYGFSPTIAARPFCYRRENISSSCVLFKYEEGSRKTCMAKINRIIEKEFPDISFEYSWAEEEYDKYLKSENTLLAILTVVSSVCVIICVFGFVSMVSLTCEERRREIAIRKINGATVKDILDIFFKEYLTLLVAGALVAFPAGYLIMKRWLENYVIQTEMSAWVYLSILLALITVIVMCVGGRVYRTSRENPVNAINR
jgi:ABC-type antimicrobial peptide transport system permease subunit